MPLNIGDWTINVSGLIEGTVGRLIITSVDGQGNVSGSVFGEPMHGKWDETKQSVAFTTATKPIVTFYSGTKKDVWLSGSLFEVNMGGGQGDSKIPEHFSIRLLLPWYAQPGCA